MPTDIGLEQRLLTLYAAPVPVELDRRVLTAIANPPLRRPARSRPRLVAALAVAVVFATAAAGPALGWFQDWSAPYDHLWEISTPVEQTVTADGYRVTVHRAYADRLGVRLAMTVEDEDDRWSELYMEAATMTDADGRAYEGWAWSGSRQPIPGSSAVWSRFLLPAQMPGDDLRLRVVVTSLAVRSPEPERIWASVPGAWAFDLDVPFDGGGESVSPEATVRADDVTVAVEELAVVPSGTVIRLSIDGLPDLPAGSAEGWYPVTGAEHDGERLTDDAVPPGILGPEGDVALELVPVVDDLTGHWKITVLGFHSFDPASGEIGEVEGSWVLEFDVD